MVVNRKSYKADPKIIKLKSPLRRRLNTHSSGPKTKGKREEENRSNKRSSGKDRRTKYAHRKRPRLGDLKGLWVVLWFFNEQIKALHVQSKQAIRSIRVQKNGGPNPSPIEESIGVQTISQSSSRAQQNYRSNQPRQQREGNPLRTLPQATLALNG